MKQYPRSLNRLINELGKLPGIGGKTAQRLAFHVLSLTDREAETLADAIVEAKRSLHYCSVCGNLTDKDVCGICSDASRDKTVICVVETCSVYGFSAIRHTCSPLNILRAMRDTPSFLVKFYHTIPCTDSALSKKQGVYLEPFLPLAEFSSLPCPSLGDGHLCEVSTDRGLGFALCP